MQLNKIQGQGQQNKPPGGPPLMAQLQQYGLQPTGSMQGDLAAINEARAEQGQQPLQMQGPQGKKGKKGPPGGGPPPEIMAQLQQYGLQPQGSKEADLAAIAQAKQQQGAQNGQNNQGMNPITQMMQMFGMQPTGTIEGDTTAFQQLLGKNQTGMNFLA